MANDHDLQTLWDWLKSLFVRQPLPTAAALASRDLYEAQVALLKWQKQLELSQALVKALQARIARLTLPEGTQK